MKKEINWFKAWQKWLADCKFNDYNQKFASYQWKLYRAGVRDVRLHDMCIKLIDEYGF
jgi:hypothetical protein